MLGLTLFSAAQLNASSFFNQEGVLKADSVRAEKLMVKALRHLETKQGRDDAYDDAYNAYKAFDASGCETKKYFALCYAGIRAFNGHSKEKGVLCLTLCKEILEENESFRHREMYGVRLIDPYEYLAIYYKNISASKYIYYIEKGISTAEKIGDQKMIAKLYNQYMVYLIDTKQHPKALEYAEKAFYATSLMKDSADILVSLVNIADAYTMMKRCEEANEALEKGLKLLHHVEGKSWNYWLYEAIGHNYLVWGKDSLSEKYLEFALKGFERLEQSHGVAITKGRYARLLYRIGQKNQSYQYRNDALRIGAEGGLKFITYMIYDNMIWAFDDLGLKDSSNFYQKKFYLLQDSMVHVEHESQAKSLMELTLIQKEHTKSEEKALKKEAVLEQQKLDNNLLFIMIIGSAGVFVLLIIVIFQKSKNTKKLESKNTQIMFQNKDLAAQRDISKTQESVIKEAHEEIKSSFEYAKGIQRIILPPVSMVKRTFSDAFVWFSPKKIISGDFYWISERKNKIHLAVSDCKKTGFGAAMISLITYNGLNNCQLLSASSDTGGFLHNLNSFIIESFDLNKDYVQRQIELALCKIDQKQQTIEFSGAHMSVLLVKEGSSAVITGDRQFIGENNSHEPFSRHELKYDKGDELYLISNGYYEEAGVDGINSLSPESFRKFISKIKQSSMEDTKERLIQHFNEYKGSSTRVADVCVVGVRL